MRSRRRFSLLCLIALPVLLWLSAGAGCSSAPVSGSPAGPGGRLGYLVVESVPAEAVVWVDGEEKGTAPVHLRIAVDDAGRTVGNIELRFVWADNRSDTTYQLRQGTLLQSMLRINQNGAMVP